MAEAQRNLLAVVIVALTILLCVLAQPTAAGNMDGMKTELREASASGSGGGSALSTAAGGNGGIFGNRRNLRSIYGLGPKMLQISRSKIPIELDLLVENEDGDRLKRFDDYGHMRFGKRGGEEQFDDYGHMRFGRST